MKRPTQPGFTLIEVMGVILVTTILLAVAINFFVNLSRQATRASENTREVRRAATILDRIAADLEHTILISKPADRDPLVHPWVFFAESRYGEGADRLQFVMRQVPRSTAGPAADLAQVAYTLHRSEDAEGDTFTLRRWAAPGLPDALRLEFPPEDDPNSFVVADDLRYFGFRFLDGGGNWVTEWNSAQLLDASELPVAVEVQIALKNGAPPVDDFGFDDQPRRHVRSVQLPLRPLDLDRLFDPDGDGARGTSGDDDGEDPDLEGLTIADCIDFNAIDSGGTGLSSSDISTLEALAQQAGDTPFAPYAGLLAGHPRGVAELPMSDRRRGIVLVVVLFFALLLTSTVATFTRKALIDHMIVANRDARSEADALARGGVRMAMALLLEDRYRAEQSGFAIDHGEELWARVSGQPFPVGDRGTLELRIEDLSSRLNLNSVIQFDDAGNPEPVGLELLNQLLLRAIDEIPLPPGDKLYDPVELAANLVDFVDEDPISLRGGAEADLYLRREPPYSPPNRPLLSVDELRQVEGFDGPLVESLRPRVTVYPYAGGGGINPNTAPPHVLALLFFNDGVDLRLAPEDAIREILEVRDAGGWVCAEASEEGCTPIGELVSENAIYPTPNFTSDVFRVVSRGQVGEVQRVVEAVYDRSQGTTPLVLSWRVR